MTITTTTQIHGNGNTTCPAESKMEKKTPAHDVGSWWERGRGILPPDLRPEYDAWCAARPLIECESLFAFASASITRYWTLECYGVRLAPLPGGRVRAQLKGTAHGRGRLGWTDIGEYASDDAVGICHAVRATLKRNANTKRKLGITHERIRPPTMADFVVALRVTLAELRLSWEAPEWRVRSVNGGRESITSPALAALANAATWDDADVRDDI